MTQQRPTNAAVEFLANAKIKKGWTNLRDHIIRDHPIGEKRLNNSPTRLFGKGLLLQKSQKYLRIAQLGYHGQS